MNHETIIRENKKRLKELYAHYNPETGLGSTIPRRKVIIEDGLYKELYLPETMFDIPVVQAIERLGSIKAVIQSTNIPYSQQVHIQVWEELCKERLIHDFEYWAYKTVKIQDKETKSNIPFKLRQPQRKLLKILDELRLKNTPIRIILLKARQWGGSTLVQVYMAWIQQCHRQNWHSAVCADVEDQARNIRSMYTRLAKEYPNEIGTITFKPFEGSTKNRIIEERGCVVGIGSAQKPDNFRSFDFSMCHLSEVGLWKETLGKKPEDLAQALRATVPSVPYSIVVLESTAKGVGNFFHREWQAATTNKESGKAGYEPIFVAWHEIEMYQKTIAHPTLPVYLGQRKINGIPTSRKEYTDFIKSMSTYDWYLWELGATLEGIHWYNWFKTSENYDDWRMQSEYPSTAQEAFQSTGRRAFAPAYVQQARKNNLKPSFIGDLFADAEKGKKALQNIDFQETKGGDLRIWQKPDRSEKVAAQYLVITDIGGRTEKADWSVITVINRSPIREHEAPEVVARWRGHLDQDLIAWKSVQIAKWYDNALLAVESNSLEKERTEGDHFLTILDEIKDYYDNLYSRTSPEKIKEGVPIKYGFHTNTSTKPMVVNALNAALRDENIIERDNRACDEMDSYEIKPNGSYGAVDGAHDDIVMTDAIGIHISATMPYPKIIVPKQRKVTYKKKVQTSF